jgi:ferredoxin
MTKIKVSVDKNKCIGSASCVVLAPEFFDLGEDGKSKALKEYVTENIETLKKAANACPVNAIILETIEA